MYSSNQLDIFMSKSQIFWISSNKKIFNIYSPFRGKENFNAEDKKYISIKLAQLSLEYLINLMKIMDKSLNEALDIFFDECIERETENAIYLLIGIRFLAYASDDMSEPIQKKITSYLEISSNTHCEIPYDDDDESSQTHNPTLAKNILIRFCEFYRSN